ncbi:hypothetical protein [Mycobacterium sp. IDR2000157661]|uniref:hypothetical protein n=1 Tax=Mycobacterium sp. IDR2000157661 TaxID=2867005 RepID=UPI001EEA5737|nr:hypothetical protein [Mycobacterium sp. IDR2000157661]ULE34233.1 hypothetical protein K3G64_06185 [Mycobacterium sp. IDR2000157661]
MPDTDTYPTQPYTPTFDTGEFAAPASVALDVPSEPLPIPAPPIVVPGNFVYLKRWMFALVVSGVWMLAAAAGGGLYHWWFHSLDKTAPVFVVLVFVVTTTVIGLLVSMSPNRPLLSALGIAVTSAPLGMVAGAAVLHGIYFCEWASRCFAGVIPY